MWAFCLYIAVAESQFLQNLSPSAIDWNSSDEDAKIALKYLLLQMDPLFKGLTQPPDGHKSCVFKLGCTHTEAALSETDCTHVENTSFHCT